MTPPWGNDTEGVSYISIIHMCMKNPAGLPGTESILGKTLGPLLRSPRFSTHYTGTTLSMLTHDLKLLASLGTHPYGRCPR